MTTATMTMGTRTQLSKEDTLYIHRQIDGLESFAFPKGCEHILRDVYENYKYTKDEILGLIKEISKQFRAKPLPGELTRLDIINIFRDNHSRCEGFNHYVSEEERDFHEYGIPVDGKEMDPEDTNWLCSVAVEQDNDTIQQTMDQMRSNTEEANKFRGTLINGVSKIIGDKNNELSKSLIDSVITNLSGMMDKVMQSNEIEEIIGAQNDDIKMIVNLYNNGTDLQKKMFEDQVWKPIVNNVISCVGSENPVEQDNVANYIEALGNIFPNVDFSKLSGSTEVPVEAAEEVVEVQEPVDNIVADAEYKEVSVEQKPQETTKTEGGDKNDVKNAVLKDSTKDTETATLPAVTNVAGTAPKKNNKSDATVATNTGDRKQSNEKKAGKDKGESNTQKDSVQAATQAQKPDEVPMTRIIVGRTLEDPNTFMSNATRYVANPTVLAMFMDKIYTDLQVETPDQKSSLLIGQILSFFCHPQHLEAILQNGYKIYVDAEAGGKMNMNLKTITFITVDAMGNKIPNVFDLVVKDLYDVNKQSIVGQIWGNPISNIVPATAIPNNG